MKKIPLVLYIIPFTLLSVFSTTYFFALGLKFLEMTIFGIGMFLPTTILPGLIFGTGIYLFLKRENFRPVTPDFILKSTFAYFLAYTAGYFGGLVSLGALGTFSAVFVGTILFLNLINKRVTPFPVSERVYLVVGLTIILGVFSVFLHNLYFESIPLPLWLEIPTYLRPLSDRIDYDSTTGPTFFGMIPQGTQYLMFLWQIVIAYKIGQFINKNKVSK